MHLQRWLALPLAVPVAFAALSFFAPAAQASVGIGVQASPVSLGIAAHAGGSYALPPVYVQNTGTQAETVTVQVMRLSKGTGRVVPPSWVRATGPGLQLAPGQSAEIPLELAVPGGAQAGPYLSDVVVSGSAATSAGRANFGVAAATKLEFSVTPGSPPGLWPFGPSWMWWTAIWLLVLAPLVIAAFRSGIRVRIRIERTPPGVAHATSRRDAMRRSGLRTVMVLLAVTGLAACGTPAPTTSGTPGGGSSIAISLNVVPTLIKVSVSPSSASFANCSGGNANVNTASTPDALGFPNGQCWLGTPGPNGSTPITITNQGVAADVYVSGANAVPSDGGTQWGLCNFGTSPVVACSGGGGNPGTNQYVAQNFSAGIINTAGLTNTIKCDFLFAGDQCLAAQGDSQTEGIKLTGPTSSSDHSTLWTVTIQWLAVSL